MINRSEFLLRRCDGGEADYVLQSTPASSAPVVHIVTTTTTDAVSSVDDIRKDSSVRRRLRLLQQSVANSKTGAAQLAV